MSEKHLELMELGRTDTETVVEVSVTVYFTQEFADYEPDVYGYVDTMVEEANLGYKNSDIPLR